MSFKVIVLVLMSTSFGQSFLSYPFPSIILREVLQSKVDQLNQVQIENGTRSFTPGYNCNRKCDGSQSMICHFEWIIEMYPTMSGACKNCANGIFSDCSHSQCVTANGKERIFMAINRQLPGPPIQVCQNDLLVVDVINEMDGSDTTIHWHGIDHSKTPFMDGVPFITQCPIHFGSTFRYKFELSEDGTFFYHSHAGQQKPNGIYGALIVRKKEDDDLFDKDLPEHVVVLSDWMNSLTENYFPGVKSAMSHPNSILINGRGRFFDEVTKNATDSPLSIFHVDQGQKFRFRLIGASSGVCPLKFQIEDHNFTIIATDSIRVKPFKADTLYISSGERFDIVVDANQMSKDSYRIRVSLVDQCIDDSYVVEEFAIMIYHRTDDQIRARPVMMKVDLEKPLDDVFITNVEMNAVVSTGNSIIALESEIIDAELIEAAPDKSFRLAFRTPVIQANDVFSGKISHKYLVIEQPASLNSVATFNKIAFTLPHVPLLSQHDEVDEEIFCNETHRRPARCYNTGICFCTHRLVASEHSIIEFLLINAEDPMTHPFHLHGHQFAVVEVGYFNSTFTVDDLDELEYKNHHSRRRKNPVYKDTVFVPKRGYVRLRYRSRSANLLFFHCHLEFHLQVGMAGVLQIGKLEDMPKVPENFPQCRNFKPELKL